jgi:phosphate transport system substrate-binding protein
MYKKEKVPASSATLKTDFCPRRPSTSLQFMLCRIVLALLTFAFTIGSSVRGLAQDSITVVGSGGSSPLPVFRAWSTDFTKRKARVRMEYVQLDTDRSIEEIIKGSGDFGGGDIPLTPEQRTRGNLVELPVLIIGVVPIYNLPAPAPQLKFTGDLLAQIYLGHVKNWNAPQIAQLNPGITLPDLPIKVFYRTPGKGTNYIFTEFLSKSNAEFRAKVGRSTSPPWPVGSSAERASDMADKVSSELGAIGFVSLEYAREKGVTAGVVKNAAGKFVSASPDSLTAACNAIEDPKWDRFAVSLTNPPGADSYPLASFSWIYLPAAGNDQKRRKALKDLMHWMFTDGQSQMLPGYSPLPGPLLAKEIEKLDSLK